MKYFILVILAAICGSVVANSMQYKQECAEKHKVKLEEVNDAYMGKTKPADVPPNMKCFFLCMGEKQKFIKDGAFHAQGFNEALSKNSDKPLVTKVATECNLKGADDCDTGYKIATCIAKTMLKDCM